MLGSRIPYKAEMPGLFRYKATERCKGFWGVSQFWSFFAGGGGQQGVFQQCHALQPDKMAWYVFDFSLSTPGYIFIILFHHF